MISALKLVFLGALKRGQVEVFEQPMVHLRLDLIKTMAPLGLFAVAASGGRDGCIRFAGLARRHRGCGCGLLRVRGRGLDRFGGADRLGFRGLLVL